MFDFNIVKFKISFRLDVTRVKKSSGKLTYIKQ